MRPNTIGFGLASHWLSKSGEFCQPIIQSSIKQNHWSKREITFDTQMKTIIYNLKLFSNNDVWLKGISASLLERLNPILTLGPILSLLM